MNFRVMSIYPAVSATRAGVFEDGIETRYAEIKHDPYEIYGSESASEQFQIRRAAVERMLGEWFSGGARLDAVIGCGLLPPGNPPGLYSLDAGFIRMMRNTHRAGRIINQGAMMASFAAGASHTRALGMVPFSSGEMDPIYRISGVPGMTFGRLTHTIHIKNALRLASSDLGASPDEVSLVIAYLGDNFSFCSHRGGRIVDFSNLFERGPFSPSRGGGIPAAALARMAYSGMWSKMDLMRLVMSEGGAWSYAGTRDMRAVISRAESGDAYSSLIVNAMVYQIAAEIAALATTLKGRPDAVVLAGEYAVNDHMAGAITGRVSWITDRVLRYAGEDELSIIARGAFSVLNGEEEARLCGAS